MLRLVPTQFNREVEKFTPDTLQPKEVVVRIKYELLDVTDEEYNLALEMVHRNSVPRL